MKVAAFALDGLAHTASRGIVHRDIKPGNIFIGENVVNGRKKLSVKLIDFEVAKQGDGSTTASATASTGNLRGSFNYMAPEFLDKRFKGDLLSDVFSMGVTLHETLTGKLPYEQIDGCGDDALLDFVARWKGVVDGKNPVLTSPDINRLLAHTDKLFLGCLSPTREQRFHSFEEFRESLRNIRFRTLTNPASGSSYQMLQFVGRGGFGEVFKARESKTGRVVAIKHLRRAKYADRFKREAKILSRLNDNCFVRFVESFARDMDGKVQEFLVMGFLDGMPGNSLRDAIKKSRGEGLPKKDVFTAFVRYAHGLRMLHAAGIFHRDIKPSNLYFPVGRPEFAAIMDLGIARDTKGTMTVGSVPGTPDYMPPEIVTAESRGESGMDIYALGLCLYEALTAKSAFARLPSDIEGFRKLVERVNGKVEPRFDDGRIDADILDLLTDMTAFNPEYRIKDVREVERRLRGFLATLAPVPASVPEPDMPNKGVWRKWLLGFAGIAGIGAIVYGALSFAFPAAKKFYAEKRLAGVLNSYRNREPDAAEKEIAWIIDFNPRSHSWLRLKEAIFVKCTNEIHAVKDGMPERQLVKRQGYKPLPPPTGFDGMDSDGDDPPFAIKPIKFSVPRLADGQRFFLRDHEYAGGEAIELEQGRYIGKYVRADKTPTDDKMYKDYFVEFAVTSNADVKIPAPGSWEYTDEYKAFLASPVDVDVPRLEEGVRCRIDGIDVKPGKVSFVPGKHLCIYEKDDCLAQTNSFEIMPGKRLSLPLPHDWKSTKDVERLRVATQLSEQKLWAKVEDAIQGVKVVTPENAKKLDSLKNGVVTWKKEEEAKRRREAVARLAKLHAAATNRIAQLLVEEPVGTRRQRLNDALVELDKTSPDGPVFNEAQKKSFADDIARRKTWVVGWVENQCAFPVSVGGRTVAAGETALFKFEDGRLPADWSCTAAGYEQKELDRNVDGKTLSLLPSDFAAKPVAMSLPVLDDGVVCYYGNEQVAGGLKLKPGSYSCVYRRSGYDDQKVNFDAPFGRDGVLPAPGRWSPKPVDYAVPATDDGVVCRVDGKTVSDRVSLVPGRHVCTYSRIDYETQKIDFSVVAGKDGTVPAPGEWMPSKALLRLNEAERLFDGGKIDEALKTLEGTSLMSAGNEKRLLSLKEKIDVAAAALRKKREREAKVKDFLDKIDLAYTPEDFLGGDARICIQCYYGAVTNGYVLNAKDRERIKHCYDVGLRDLKDQRKSVDGQISQKVRPFRNPNDIDNDIQQLNEWYTALRK